jgi:nitrous oxidase accessory protein NosD
MRRRFGVGLLVSVLLLLPAGLGASADALSIVSQEANSGIGIVTSLLTGIDSTITDTAVTDAALVSAGALDNSLPTLLTPPNLLIVDDDRVQCPNAQYTTISGAVLAAPPGATIRVCPGLYRESVFITKPLTLQAPRQQGEATECMTPTADDPTKEAIVQYGKGLNGGNPSEGFDVESSNVTIEGFKVEPDPSIVKNDGVGIFTSPNFAGYNIQHNVLQNNSIGIYVNSSGAAPTSIQKNCLRLNNLAGAAGGNGVYSDQGLSNAQITNNYFTGDQNAAIVVDAFLTTPHDIAITHNSSVNDGAIVTFASNGPPAYNLIVDYNKVTGSVGSGVVTYNVTNSEYAYNDLENGTFNGVSLHMTTSSTVKSNKATGFKLNGIRIGEKSNGNSINTNRSENNVQAGLALKTNSIGNTIDQNHMKGNAPDCYDDTLGSGTAGTANIWTRDFGMTENRAGLCKHATV